MTREPKPASAGDADSPTPEDQRTVIARIIHPNAWSPGDPYKSPIGDEIDRRNREISLDKADAILASLPQARAVGDEERAALSTISPPRDLERPDDVTAWLVEETWSGFVHYVHISFDAARFLREHQRNKERPPGATARHNERMITKNIDEAMRFPTKEAADAWLKVQPSWMQSDQFQVREHMWPAPASSDLERLRGLSEALAELPETFSGQARASQMIADEAQNGSYSKGRANGEAAAYTHAAQIVSHQLKEPRAALATLPPAPGWRCFHCDETFADETCAREHFGAYQDCDPICKVGAERYRDLEDQLAVFRNESDAASKEFYALGAKHTQERMRAEEQGYERGLRDARHQEIWRALLKAQPLPSPPSPRDAPRAPLSPMTIILGGWAPDTIKSATMRVKLRLQKRSGDLWWDRHTPELMAEEIIAALASASPAPGMDDETIHQGRELNRLLAAGASPAPEGFSLDVASDGLHRVAQERHLIEAVRQIGLRAYSGDGSRTMDDCMRDLSWIDDECRRLLADSGADKDEAEGLRHWLRRIEEVTAIPADKRADVDHMRAAVMLARSYACAGLLSDSPEEGLGADEGPQGAGG